MSLEKTILPLMWYVSKVCAWSLCGGGSHIRCAGRARILCSSRAWCAAGDRQPTGGTTRRVGPKMLEARNGWEKNVWQPRGRAMASRVTGLRPTCGTRSEKPAHPGRLDAYACSTQRPTGPWCGTVEGHGGHPWSHVLCQPAWQPEPASCTSWPQQQGSTCTRCTQELTGSLD